MPKSATQDNNKIRETKAGRRRYLTWLRMMRYGVNNFTRNAWLTTAATAVMTITLLIIFSTLVARTVLSDTVNNLRQNINLSIFLRSDIDDATVRTIRSKLEADPNVKKVTFVSSDEGRQRYIDNNTNPDDVEVLKTLAESEISIPSKFDINVDDPDKITSIEKLIKTDKDVTDNLFAGARQLDGDTRSAIKTIGEWADTADKAGIVSTAVFVAISMLIVFNTIRMAIFNRRDEIEMMKLIGADKSFIRGPFVVEAVMYGFFAALAATGIGYFALMSFRQQIADYGVTVDRVAGILVFWAPVVLLAMIALGALIGIVSSRLAVRRYLKV